MFLLASALLGSFMTASVGAGGGIFLSVMMASWLPPAAITPVHGLVQLGSNAGRACLTWRHIRWPVIADFSLALRLLWLAVSALALSLNAVAGEADMSDRAISFMKTS